MNNIAHAEPRDARDVDTALMAFAADAVGALLQAHPDGTPD